MLLAAGLALSAVAQAHAETTGLAKSQAPCHSHESSTPLDLQAKDCEALCLSAADHFLATSAIVPSEPAPEAVAITVRFDNEFRDQKPVVQDKRREARLDGNVLYLTTGRLRL